MFRLNKVVGACLASGVAVVVGVAFSLLMVGSSRAETHRGEVWLPYFVEGASQRVARAEGMFISEGELRALPTSGGAWNNLLDWAGESAANPELKDQNDDTDAVVVAKALVYARTGQAVYREQVIEAIERVMGSERGSGILAVARNLAGYVIAADLVKLDGATDARFRAWLEEVRFQVFDGQGPDLSLVSCHEERPNNFGTHCGTSRIAAALYLGDEGEVQRAANVFRGWLGDRNAYRGFKFGSDLSWHCDPNQPVGINPADCQKEGKTLSGVLPDDQRRGGSYSWPPPKENYVWEALQGALGQAYLLERQGYDPFGWSEQGLLRATGWLYETASFGANGDDSGLPWLIDARYGTGFASNAAHPGKNGLGFYDWLTSANR